MNKYQEIVKEDLLPCPICGEDNADFVAIEDTGPNRGAGLAVMCDCGCAVMTGIEYNISGNSLEELCSASAQWNKSLGGKIGSKNSKYDTIRNKENLDGWIFYHANILGNKCDPVMENKGSEGMVAVAWVDTVTGDRIEVIYD